MKQHDLLQATQDTLNGWRSEEKQALELLKLAGDLRFDKGIELIMFREDVYNTRPSDLINYHQLSKKYVAHPLPISLTLEIAQIINFWKDACPMKLDLGVLASDWYTAGKPDLTDFVENRLSEITNEKNPDHEPCDVVLYGFGRIGRLLARRIVSTTGRGDQLRLRAIVLRSKMTDRYEELEKRAALLVDDSIHGRFPGKVEINAEDSTLTVNGNLIHIIFANNPEDIDYTEYGIYNALVIDNTGVWRDREGLRRHLRPGATRVMLTAPGKNVPNIVHGVNQDEALFENETVISAASCTTNAIVPVIKTIDDALGIEEGHIETIHAYTSDQNLLDNFHKKPRRGRGAATNMVLTTTGAAKAVSKVLPHLEGKLTGNAVRVPTPDVSIAIMNLTLSKSSTIEEINELLKIASLHGPLVEQIHYSTSTEYVSSNAIGMTSTSVVDAPSTLVSADGKRATIYVWYDNEYGYCCQVVRLAKHFAHVRRPYYY